MKNYNRHVSDDCKRDDGRVKDECKDKPENRVKPKPTDKPIDGSDPTDKPRDGSDPSDKPIDNSGSGNINDGRFLTALRYLKDDSDREDPNKPNKGEDPNKPSKGSDGGKDGRTRLTIKCNMTPEEKKAWEKKKAEIKKAFREKLKARREALIKKKREEMKRKIGALKKRREQFIKYQKQCFRRLFKFTTGLMCMQCDANWQEFFV